MRVPAGSMRSGHLRGASPVLDIDSGAASNPAAAEWEAAGLRAPDMDAVRSWRLQQLRQQLEAEDLAGIVLFDPLNIRYATDATNMQVWTTHNPVRYAFVATDGPVVLFDLARCEHLVEHLPLIDEVRPATGWFFFENGPREAEAADRWADEIADLVRSHGRGSLRVGLDKCESLGLAALQRRGLDTVATMRTAELARYRKHPEEIAAMRRAVHAGQQAVREMWQALEPGITEAQLWSHLHAGNIARGGEWVETRLLSSGPRTNPWFAECSHRVIEAGDLVCFDTDLIGPYGYAVDMSRSWVTPGREPTAQQQSLHSLACEVLAHNCALLKPGLTFREFAERSYQLPDRYLPNRYADIAHGLGLSTEYPMIHYIQDWDAYGYDGVIEDSVVMCLEVYVGEPGGPEGVKLENQIYVASNGAEVLDTFPMSLTPH
ncbi:MAG: aminopeptidase P family protein [Acidimicrobiaceae bacterium]|nr:aminopeptidase P family protein [Acidimicrobiaceae bacterium]MYF43944.1 aminopeptidase P family protein [Acidimicrobiaceae bacterium]MYJ35777.1 aminopeptidase P family protein [Acidimicrobiaceae bacterium]